MESGNHFKKGNSVIKTCFLLLAAFVVVLTSCKKTADDDTGGSKGSLTGSSWVFIHSYNESTTIEFEYTYTLKFTKAGVGTHTQTGWRRVRYSSFGTWGEKENMNEVNEITYTYNAGTKDGFITESMRESFYISADFTKLTWGNRIYSALK